MTRQRRQFTPEQKVALLREHFLDKVPVSDLCQAGKLRQADADGKDRKIAALEDKLQRKHEVLSELMEEHVQLKKALGEL